MAAALRSTSSAQNQTGATFSVTKPAGATDGDLLVAFQCTAFDLSGAQPVAPSGWTLLDRTLYAANACDLACFYRVVSGDGASYTFNNSVGAMSPSSNVRINCWSGAASAPGTATKNTGSGTFPLALAVTTTAANSYVSGAYGINFSLGTTIDPTPSGLSDQGQLGNSTVAMNSGNVLQASAGSSGDKQADLNASQSWAALLTWIGPSSPAPTAAFSGTPTSGDAPLEVAFTDESTGSPTSWLWEKNDGSGYVNFEGTPTAQNPTEEFAAGTWDVKLTATNAGGSDAEEKLDYITAEAPPAGGGSGMSPGRPLAMSRVGGGTILRHRLGSK